MPNFFLKLVHCWPLIKIQVSHKNIHNQFQIVIFMDFKQFFFLFAVI